MRLTKTDKDAFVRAVMADTPEPDFNEQAAALVHPVELATVPEKVRAILQDPELSGYIRRSETVCTPGGLRDVGVVVPIQMPPEVWAQLEALALESRTHRERRSAARDQLRALIAPLTTLAAAKKRLPGELHKYLPTDRDETGVTNLPAVVSPVDLLRALGWPK